MKKRRHHTVWRHYLNAWATDERIACWRRGAVFTTSTINVAVDTDFYRLREMSAEDVEGVRRLIATFPPQIHDLHVGWLATFQLPFQLIEAYRHSGVRSDALEEELDRAIFNAEEDLHAVFERSALPMLESLRRGDTAFFQTSQGYSAFMHFLSLQHLRTRRGQARTLSALRGHPTMNIEKTWPVLRHIFATNMGAALILRRDEFRMTLLTAPPSAPFITGDQPTLNTFGEGLRERRTPERLEFYYPVTPKLSVLVGSKKDKPRPPRIDLTEDRVAQYNGMVFSRAHDQVFASEESVLRALPTMRPETFRDVTHDGNTAGPVGSVHPNRPQ